MLIWRGLQPKVMAQLMVGLAQAREAERVAARKNQASAPAPAPQQKTPAE